MRILLALTRSQASSADRTSALAQHELSSDAKPLISTMCTSHEELETVTHKLRTVRVETVLSDFERRLSCDCLWELATSFMCLRLLPLAGA